MSRRQALGVISNQYTNNQQLGGNSLKPQHPFKSNPSLNNINNGNENACVFTKKPSSEFDFEIFQEEYDEKLSKKDMRLALTDKENIGSSLGLKQEKVVFATDYDDDDYVEDEEEDEAEEEEDGICRFKSELSSDKLSAQFQNDLNVMMESSNSDSSPMVLDDTMKFASSSDTSECLDDSEESKQNKLVEERENLLVNCSEYKDDILAYMRQEEQVNRPKANYMKKQQDISGSMRSILIDWLVEVSEEYKLNIETLYLAVNYTDRFLSHMSVLRGKLQLVGTASMYIASKYEEISPPDVSEFVYITDDTYTKKQVLRMEHLLLKVLDFRMNTPTTNNFLTHYLRFLKMSSLITSEKVDHLARYLAELTLIESDTFLNFLPSQIAASAIYLSMFTLGKKWTKSIAEQLGYDFELTELKDCINALHKSMKEAPELPQQAIQEKYKSDKFNGVSLLEAPHNLPTLINQ